MIETRMIGNIFAVDRKINFKTILIPIITILLMALSKFIFDNQNISANITLQDLMYLPIISTILYTFFKYNLIGKLFKEYFNFKFEVIILILFYTLISIYIVTLPDPKIYLFFSVILFCFSGFQRIVIQKTKALFFTDIYEFMDFIQIYGYTRAAFFSIPIIYFVNILVYNSPLVGLIYYLIIFVFIFLFVANLYPYCNKHKDIKKTILIIRKIAENKNIKINNLNSLVDSSDVFIQKQLNRLALVGYISIENGRVKLKDEYQKIYE
jgi:hypothetical protein